MNVIVVGCGNVGGNVAAVLSREKHNVTLIDQDASRLADVQERLDILTLVGNGASPRILESALAREADLLIAATNIDEVNMIACAHAKAFGVAKTVARIHHPDYLHATALSFDSRGIDHVINPDEATAIEIERLLEHTWAIDAAEFVGGRVEMMGMRLGAEDAIVGKSLIEIGAMGIARSIKIAAVARGEEFLVPRGATRLEEGDIVYVIGLRGALSAIAFLCGHPDAGVERLAIFGASRIGMMLARSLEKRKIEVKIIEDDRERATACAAEFEKTMVIHGDGTDAKVLREENIQEMDGFVAVSGRDETNLLAAALVARLGVPKTIAVLQRDDYAALSAEMDVSATVTVTSATADAILRFVRRGTLHGITTIHGGAGEVFELEAPVGIEILDKPLASLTLPKEILIGAVVHGEKVEIAYGETVIRAGDRVVLLVTADSVGIVERLFNPRVEGWRLFSRR
jgi:trk system potassium uptake protein TrkA